MPMPVQAVNAPAPVNTGHASNAELCTTVVSDTSSQVGTTVHVLRARNDGRTGRKHQAEASSILTSTQNKRLLEANVYRDMNSSQEAQLPQRNSASAAHVYLGWHSGEYTVWFLTCWYLAI